MFNYDDALISAARPEETPLIVYPYRRVWRSVVLLFGSILFMVVLVIGGVAFGILRNVPSRNWGLLMTLIPLATYLYFAVRGERKAAEPREGLLTVLLFSALLANGVGLPLVEGFFAPREWLSEAGFFSRVLGYAFTAGIVSEFLKYVAIRYTVWPRRFRCRMDGIAYSVAASMGYAIVRNAYVIIEDNPTVTAEVVRIAFNFITEIGFGVVVGYFMAEMALRPQRPPFFLGSGLAIAAILDGLFFGFRAVAVGSSFAVSPIRGLLVGLGFALAVMFAINYLIEVAEGREASLAGRRRVR